MTGMLWLLMFLEPEQQDINDEPPLKKEVRFAFRLQQQAAQLTDCVMLDALPILL